MLSFRAQRLLSHSITALTRTPFTRKSLAQPTSHLCTFQRPLRRQDSEMVRMSSIELVPSLADQPDKLVQNLNELQSNATKERIPWFLESMPTSYFRNVSRERRLEHLVSIAAIPDMEHIPEIVSFNADGNGMAMVSSGKEMQGKLVRQLAKLPADAVLAGLHLYTSKDGVLSISEFNFDNKEMGSQLPILQNVELSHDVKEYAKQLQEGKFEADREQYFNNTGEVLHAKPSEYLSEEKLTKFASFGSEGMIDRMTPRRLCKFVEMYHTLLKRGTDEVLLDVETNWGKDPSKVMYTLALTNVLVKPTLTRISKYLESRGMLIERVHLDKVRQEVLHDKEEAVPGYNDVSFLRILTTSTLEGASHEAVLAEMKQCLPLISKWLDERVIKLSTSEEQYKFCQAHNLDPNPIDYEILVALMDCVHLSKARVEMYEFSKSNIETVLSRPQAYQIVDLFKQKFSPGGSDEALSKRGQEIRDELDQYVEVAMQHKVLTQMLNIVENTVKTNLHEPERFGLAMKLNPTVFMDLEKDTLRSETPYGVFYVSGRRFTGIQVRFREIARGGLRLVTPATKELHSIESSRQFNEAYDLAFAQQLKNKDIPEGGSKAVCLINVEDIKAGQTKEHIMRKSVKAFVNSILDLIAPDKELIYLGPDEQITIDHINWIIHRAKERGYVMPNAFMSSKPLTGINHKEFGVTSEGVQVFLDTALKSLNILDKPSFTVKLTGGPDGDVAGNMLKILYREYGDKCKVVGIADGTGCVENEVEGIEWAELLRLANESLPLSSINKSSVSSNTKVHLLDSAQGAHMRNTLHNRVKADAFIPAGGRPATINDSNWRAYLSKDGAPSSPLIVEGANLFLTKGAREELSKLGVVIVKDSSANKCGVICSSFEIISSMLLEPSDFIRVKSELVPQVLEKLRNVARKEAELLMSEYRLSNGNKNLVNVSMEISQALNRTKDALRERLTTLFEDKKQQNKYKPLVKDYLPRILVKEGWKNFEEKVPDKYVINLVANVIASELVYNEGTDFVNAIKDDAVLSKLAMDYSQEKKNIHSLVDKLVNSRQLAPEEAALVARLLEYGGARTAVNLGGFDNI